MALSDAARSVLQYWGAISHAVAERASTADVVAAIRADAGIPTGPIPGFSLQGLNEIRSQAATIRNASESLSSSLALAARTGLDQTIDSRMISTAPWSRDPAVVSSLANFQVRFEYQTTDPAGNVTSTWMTAMFPPDRMPATTDALLSELGTYGNLSGSAPQGDFSGLGTIEILAV